MKTPETITAGVCTAEVGKQSWESSEPRDSAGKNTLSVRQLGAKERHRKFCIELLKHDFCATEAYMSVYRPKSRKTAEANGSRLLSHAKVQKVLAELVGQVHRKQEVEAEYVYRKWLQHTEASPLDYFRSDSDGNLVLRDLTKLPEEIQKNLRQLDIVTTEIPVKDGPPIKKQTIKVAVVDQQRSLEMLARSLGMFQTVAVNQTTNVAVLIRQGVSRIKDSGKLDGHRVIDQE